MAQVDPGTNLEPKTKKIPKAKSRRQCLNAEWYQICVNLADIGCKRYT
jgi:hypothetical protein